MKPVTLSCGHTFCQFCIGKHIKSKCEDTCHICLAQITAITPSIVIGNLCHDIFFRDLPIEELEKLIEVRKPGYMACANDISRK